MSDEINIVNPALEEEDPQTAAPEDAAIEATPAEVEPKRKRAPRKTKAAAEQESVEAPKTDEEFDPEMINTVSGGDEDSAAADMDGDIGEGREDNTVMTRSGRKSVKTLPQSKPEAADATAAPTRRGRKPAASKDSTLPPPVSEDEIKRDENYTRNSFMNSARANTARRSEYNDAKAKRLGVTSRLNDLRRTQRIVTGRIIGVTPPETGVHAIALFEDMQVLIPYRDMFIDGTLVAGVDDSLDSVARRQFQILRKTANATIDFVVKDYYERKDEPGEFIIVGNRREALLRIQKRNYVPRGDKPAVVQEGEVYPGTIIGIGNWGVRINVMGVDTQIWASDMTYRPVENLDLMYTPGDQVKVMVKSIKVNERGELTIKGSCKAPELEQYEKAVKNVPLGSHVLAKVSFIPAGRGDNPAAVPVFLEGFKVPGLAVRIKYDAMKEPLRPGALVMFRAESILNNAPIVRGSIMKTVDSDVRSYN